jgi:hypothetical protein
MGESGGEIMKLAWAWIVLGLLVVVPGRAATLFLQDAGDESLEFGISSSLNFSGQGPGYRVFDNFQLGAGALVTTVTWWGLQDAGGEGFEVTFYEGGATPGSLLGTFNVTPVTSTVNFGSPDITRYEAALAGGFNASGGTGYWISVFNAAPDATWSWVNAQTRGSALGQGVGSLDYDSLRDRAFALGTQSEVPEPGTWMLAGGALLGLGWLRSRRQVARTPR